MRVLRLTCSRGLSDHWLSANLVKWLSAVTGAPVAVTGHGEQTGADWWAAHQEVMALLRGPGESYRVEDPPTWRPTYHQAGVLLDGRYFPAGPGWRRETTYACYQFDGSSYPQKNPWDVEVDGILEGLAAWGLEPLRVGRPLTVAEQVQVLRRCAVFIGCSSGISHVAKSVGCPIVLSWFHGQDILSRLHNWHRGWFKDQAYLAEGGDDWRRNVGEVLALADLALGGGGRRPRTWEGPPW